MFCPVHLVVCHGGADPAVVAADAGEDAGVSWHGAVVAPGDDPLQLTAADQRAAGVPLQAQADLSVTTWNLKNVEKTLEKTHPDTHVKAHIYAKKVLL